MNPGDLLNTKFERKMGGYKAADVDNFLVEAAALYSQQTRENTELKRKLETANRKLQDYEQDKDSLREALLNAQKLADSIVRDARTKAEKVEQEAEGRANSLMLEMRGEILAEQEKLNEMKRRVSEFRSELMNMYRAHIELISEMPVFHEEEPAADDAPAEQAETPAETLPEETPSEATAFDEVAAAESADAGQTTEETEPAGEAASAEETDNQLPEEAPEAEETEEKADDGVDESHFGLKLNVKFDEASGEYIPLESNGKKFKAYDGGDRK